LFHIFIAVIAFWFIKIAIRKPPFILEITIPSETPSQGVFDVIFTIRNLSDNNKILESIDIYKTFLSNFCI